MSIIQTDISPIVIDHTHPKYVAKRDSIGKGRWNGAYYYSKEIVKNIIPNVNTDRSWITVNEAKECRDHSIVFIHNNLHPEHYDWLHVYKDLILVCGVPETCNKVAHLGKPIYLPLSIDVKYVERFKTAKTKDTAYVGRGMKARQYKFLDNVDKVENIPRDELLAKIAEYRNVYAVGRCAIEAKVLDCNILPYDVRFPDTSIWKVVDNLDAAKMLQKMLNIIDS